jgi:hypothetical protein
MALPPHCELYFQEIFNAMSADTMTEEHKDEPEAQTQSPNEADPEMIVSWDGPNDSANPMNWSMQRKWGIIAMISFLTFLTYVCLFSVRRY